MAQPTGPDPIRVIAKLSKSTLDYSKPELPRIYAEVFKSGVPVLNAEVHARVETDSSSCEIMLKDDGRGLYYVI